MAAPKPKGTIIEKHGFRDPELKTKAHDDLVLEVYSNPIKYLSTAWPNSEWDWNTVQQQQHVTEIQERVRESIDFTAKQKKEGNTKFSDVDVDSIKVPEIPEYKEAEVYQKQLEHPIKDRNWIIGFVDLVFHTKVPVIKPSKSLYDPRKEPSVYTIRKTPIITCECVFETFCVEVKTKIPSVGELLRQINMYRSYPLDTHTSKVQWVVACPDDTYREVLDEQGVGFIKL